MHQNTQRHKTIRHLIQFFKGRTLPHRTSPHGRMPRNTVADSIFQREKLTTQHLASPYKTPRNLTQPHQNQIFQRPNWTAPYATLPRLTQDHRIQFFKGLTKPNHTIHDLTKRHQAAPLTTGPHSIFQMPKDTLRNLTLHGSTQP